MTSSDRSQSRSRALIGVVVAVLVAAVVWLADPFAPGLSIDTTHANGSAPPFGASADAGDSTGPRPVASAARNQAPVAADRGFITGRVLFSGAPVADATVRLAKEPATTTSSATDGTFALDLGPGTQQIGIAGAGSPGTSRWLTVERGQTFALGDIRLPLPASVRGRVVDEHGIGIVGALVELVDASENYFAGLTLPDTGPPPVTTRTGRDGQFHFHGLLELPRRVLAEHPGCRTAQRTVEPEAGATVDLGEIVLVRHEPVRGVVVGPDGAPIVGARVVAGGKGVDPVRRRGVARTDARGAFVLDPAPLDLLTVFADGCQPRQVATHDPGPLRIELSTARAIHGHVVGAGGAEGRVFCTFDPRAMVDGLWAKDQLRAAFPIAPDGSFTIPYFTEGPWRFEAEVPGVGRSDIVDVNVPTTGPVRIPLLAHRQLALEVVDDLGAPVAGASAVVCVELNRSGWGARNHSTGLDAADRGRVAVCTERDCRLEITGPHHARTRIEVDRDGPDAMRVVLPRVGVVHGVVARADLGRCNWRVEAESVPPSGPMLSFEVDAEGCFVAALPPGEHRIRLEARSGPWPLIATTGGPEVLVDVRSGDNVTIELQPPKLLEVRGKVLAAGRPVADALVLATTREQRSAHGLPTHAIDQHRDRPHMRTDGEGRFHFLASDALNDVELRARHRRSGVWSAPVAVPAGVDREVDIGLAAAVVRGRFDFGTLPRASRADLAAFLIPRDVAEQPHDFALVDLIDDRFLVPNCPLGVDGSFAFELVPPGDYLLRIGTATSPLVQRIVQPVGDEVLDQGLLAVPIAHAVRIPTNLPEQPDGSVLVMLPIANSKRGAFVTTGTVESGVLVVDALPAGTYRVLLQERDADVAAAVITVLGDGTATPARVAFSPIR